MHGADTDRGDFQEGWQRLRLLVSGRSEFGKGELAAQKAREAAQRLAAQHGVSVTLPAVTLARAARREGALMFWALIVALLAFAFCMHLLAER